MASETTNIGLVKQAGTEYGDNDITNSNLDKIDEEIWKRGKTVNGIAPDNNGNFNVEEVPFARQLVTDDAQQSSGEYQFRTTGGDASLSDGDAKLVRILGRSTHTGIVSESLTMTVTPAQRQEGEEPITAEIDRDTFVEYVSESGTITLTYTDAWSANPTLYGVTVTGEPVSGDQIVIVYVKENRGTITVSNPTRFISTGWNLYNHSATYARVKKYSDTYGFKISGTYTALKFSNTLTGTKSTITPVSGAFTIPSDGYVWVTGGNSTDTAIWMTWSDWTSGYEGSFKAYSESIVNFATVASTNFPYGMMQVEGYADELDFGLGKAISRIDRMAYTAENLAAVKASGLPYDADETYIYAVRATEIVSPMSVSGDHTANDHGMEIVDGGTIAPYLQTIYGENLVDKLRTDVVTKSSDIVNNLASTATNKALSAYQGNVLNAAIAGIEDGLAIVANGNTHAAIKAGQFVYVKNHNTLSEGLYKNTSGSTIAANATLSSSNLTADSSGGLNALYGGTIRNNMECYQSATTMAAVQTAIKNKVDEMSTIQSPSAMNFGYLNTTAAQSIELTNASYINVYWTGSGIILVEFISVGTDVGTRKYMRYVSGTWSALH